MMAPDATGSSLYVSRPALPAAASPTATAAVAAARSRKPRREHIKGGKPREATFSAGGSTSSASKRADGCAIRGKTKA